MLDLIPAKLISPQWSWILNSLVHLAIALIVSLFLWQIGSWITRKVEKKKGEGAVGLAQTIDSILFPPFYFLIWALFLVNTAGFIGFHYDVDFLKKYIASIRGAVIVVAVAWILLRWLHTGFARLKAKAVQYGIAINTVYALNRLVSTLIFIFSLLTIFQIFGLNIIPFLTFGGIGVAGIAFAAQDMIANFFGGTMLYFTGSFSPGDQIIIPSSNFDGTVKEVGWYITVIEDSMKRPVYFPNALFSKTHIINESRRTHRCLKETVMLNYGDLSRIEMIIQAIRKEIKAHPEVDATQHFSVSFNKFEEEWLEIGIHLFVYNGGYGKFLETKQEILLLIKKAVENESGNLGPAVMQVNVTTDPSQRPF